MSGLYDKYKKRKEGSEKSGSSTLYEKYKKRVEEASTSTEEQETKVEKPDALSKYISAKWNPDFEEMSQYKGTKDGDYVSDSKWVNTKAFKQIGDTAEWIKNSVTGNSIENLYNDINVKSQSDHPYSKAADAVKSFLGYENNPWDVMTDEEKALFNYFYNTGDKEKAQSLYNDIMSDLTGRVRTAQQEKANEEVTNGLDVALMWPKTTIPNIAAGLNQLALGGSYAAYEALTGGDPYKAWNDVAQVNFMGSNVDAQREAGSNVIAKATGSDTVLPMAYQTLMQVGDSALTMGLFSGMGLSEGAIKVLTKLPMSGNVVRQKAIDVLQNGGTQEEAALSSLASGAISYITESIGTDTMFDILTGRLSAETAKKFILKSLVASAGAEAAEEGIEDVANLISDYLLLDVNQKKGADSEWMRYYKELIANGKSENAAKGETVWAFIKNTGLDMLGGAMGGAFGGGMEAVPGYFNYRKSGQAIQGGEKLENLKGQLKEAGKENLANTLENNPSKADIGYAQNTLVKDVYEKVNNEDLSREEREKNAKLLSEIAENEVPKTGIADKKGNALHLVDVKWDGDTPTFVAKEGTYKLKDVNISDSTSRLVSLTEDLPEMTRQAFIENYSGGNLGDYISAFNLVYEYGKKGFTDKLQSVIDNHILSKEQVYSIYRAAVADKTSVTSRLERAQERIEERKKLFPDRKTRARIDDSTINYDELSDSQKDQMKLAGYIAQAFNVNLSFFNSKTTEENIRKYTNGQYDPETNTIYLDVNATNTGTNDTTNAIITAMSHELTHWARELSPEQWGVFRKIMLGALAEEFNKTQGSDLDIASFVKFMQNETPEYRNLSTEKVEEELICRACENMLQNSSFAQKALGEMTAEQRTTLKEKVTELFNKIKELIQKIMGRSDSQSNMYKLLARNKDLLDEMQERWDNMIKEASENSAYRNAEIEEGTFEAENEEAEDISFGDRDQEERSYSKKVNAEPDYFTKEDSAGRQLTSGQRAYFARSAIRDNEGRLLVVYHGTPTGGFTVFRNGLTYFTANKEYAERYTRMSSSGKTGTTPQVYSGYINIVNPFTLTDSAAKDIYINEYIKGGYAQGMDPNASDAEINKYAENGIDWTEADNLKEFFDEKGYDYDGIILNEGGDLTENGTVMRGNSFVTFSQEQFKDRENKTPTINPDINLSWKDDEGYLHLDFDDELSPSDIEKLVNDKNFNKQLNEAIQKKVERREKNRIAKLRQVDRKMKLSQTKIDDLAREIKSTYELPQTLKEISEGLKEVYLKTTETSFDSALNDLMVKLFKDVKPNYINYDLKREAENFKKSLHKEVISLSENQKNELRRAYGSSWLKDHFLGRVTLKKNGTSLDSRWSEITQNYPDLFPNPTEIDADEGIELAEALDLVYSGKFYTNESFDITKDMKKTFIEQVRAAKWDVVEDLTMAEKYTEAIGELRRKIKMTEEMQKKVELAKQQVKEDAQRHMIIDKIIEREVKLAKMLRTNGQKEHIPQILQEPLQEILTAVDVGAYAPDKLVKQFNALAKALENVSSNSEAEENLLLYFDSSPYFVEQVRDIAAELQKKISEFEDTTNGQTSILDLSTQSLRKLNQTLAAVTMAVHKYDRALASDTNQRISERDEETFRFVGHFMQRGKVPAWAKDIITFFAWDNTTPVYGYDRFGKGGRDTFKGIMDGDDQLTRNSERIIDFCKETFTGEELDQWNKDIKPVTINGKEYSMTTAQIMTLYCLNKRQSAQQHLYEDQKNIYGETVNGKGIVINTNSKAEKSVATKITKGEVAAITSLLTDRQTAVADALQEFMSTVCSDWGNYVTMKRFGIMQFLEDNYFPMNVSQAGAEKEPAPSGTGWRVDIFRLLNMGFTKSLNERGDGALIIDGIFDVFLKHSGEMAAYNAYALPILDAYKWMSYKGKGWSDLNAIQSNDPEKRVSFTEVVEQAYGTDGINFIQNHLRDLNGTKNITTSATSLAQKLIRSYKTAATAANLRVTLMQPTSYLRAANEINIKYLAKAIRLNPKEIKETIARMNENSALAQKKNGLGAYDVNVSRSIAEQAMQTENVKDVKGVLSKARSLSMWAAMKADEITWATLYRAVELETLNNTSMVPSPEFDAYVAERFRDICYRTQVFDSINARSNLMRKTSDTYLGILTAFGSEPTLSYSMLINNVFLYTMEARTNAGVAWQRYGKRILRAFTAFMMSATAVSAVAALPDWLRDDEEDDGFLKKYFQNFGLNLIAEVMGLLPFMRDVYEGTAGFLKYIPAFKDADLRSYDPSRPDEEIIKSVRQAGEATIKAIEDGQITYRTVYNAAKLFSQATGLPVANMIRDFKSIWNKTIGEAFGMKIK